MDSASVARPGFYFPDLAPHAVHRVSLLIRDNECKLKVNEIQRNIQFAYDIKKNHNCKSVVLMRGHT